MTQTHTPGPWFVREMRRHGNLHGYFVSAADVNGFAYDAEILGEDEYRDGMARWSADAHLIAAAPVMREALAAINRVLAETRSKPSGTIAADIEWCIDEARRAIALSTPTLDNSHP